MGRWSNCPHEVESLKCITIADLKKLGYLQPNIFLSGNIFWTNQYGERTGAVTVIIDTTETDGYITFDYTYNQSKNVNYKVRLITRPFQPWKWPAVVFCLSEYCEGMPEAAFE